jgi:predicted ATP-binding protein involved in virulence
MRVDQLGLKNFRGFRELTLNLRPSLTVLVGVNGTGKTTILDALALMLASIPMRLTSEAEAAPQLTVYDFYKGEDTVSSRLHLTINEQQYSLWLSAQRLLSKVDTKISDVNISFFTSELRARLRGNAMTGVPLALYFPVNRAVLDIPDRTRSPQSFDQFSAFENALSNNWNNFRAFYEWFRAQEDLENERRVANPSYRDPQLEAVRRAVSSLLENYGNLRVERQPPRMVIEKDGEKLAVNQLSDGEKCLLALAGDLARRLALANPGSSNPLSCSAVVLIDEVELHLHPRWQRRVLPALLRTFPQCQFVVSTHSPQVLSEVQSEDIVLLVRRDGDVQVTGVQSSFGRDSNWILETIMEVDERPTEIKERIERCFALLDEGRLEEARREKVSLEQLLGTDDPELLRADLLLRRKESLKRAPGHQGS